MDARLTVPGAVLLAALGAAGCGPEPDFITRHGVAFHLNGATFLERAQAEELEADFLQRLSVWPRYARRSTSDCVEQAWVQIVPQGLFACASDPKATCAGEQYGSMLKVAATDCPYDSAYVHELLHWVQECVAGRVDYHHEDETWRVVDEMLSEGVRRCAEWDAPGPGERAHFFSPETNASHRNT